MLDKYKVEAWTILLLQGPHRCIGLCGDDPGHEDCLLLLRAIAKDILETVEKEELALVKP